MVDISKFFRLRRLSAPQAINYGYYEVKRDQNFDFLSATANVWKALKAGANIQQFFTEISSWAPEVRPPLRKNFVHIFVCAPPPPWQNPGDGPGNGWGMGTLGWKFFVFFSTLSAPVGTCYSALVYSKPIAYSEYSGNNQSNVWFICFKFPMINQKPLFSYNLQLQIDLRTHIIRLMNDKANANYVFMN